MGLFHSFMRAKRLLFTILVILLPLFSAAQPSEYKMSAKEYIERYKEDAVKEMLMHGVPASITLAQGMLESGNGNSALAVFANNHFGIKCHKGWTGPTYIMDDDAANECFRKYPSVLDSYSDHSLFLKSRPRYAFLFELKRTDYAGWARGLKQAGYATDPRYADRLIDIIEQHKLYLYDQDTEMPSITVSAETPQPPKMVTRKVMHFNNRKYVIVKPGDTFYRIAVETDVELWQLYKYNEMDKGSKLVPGTKMYIQPKRNKAKEKYHVVEKGETLHSISQLHGIKMKALCRKNGLEPTDKLTPGDKLYLRKKRPDLAGK
jgi:LysM repeat protein